MVALLTTSPFRINAPPAALASSPSAKLSPALHGYVKHSNVTKAAIPSPSSASKEGDEYVQRLIKLIPSEVLALYLTFHEIATSWLGIWALICLALVILVRTVGTHKAGKPIQFISVAVAAISFVIWVYATGGYFLQFKPPENLPGITSVSVGVWTFIIPYFYKGD